MLELKNIADTLERAFLEGRATPQFSASGRFSVEDGYRVQRLGFEKALSRGEHLAGYKMGLTSRAKQRDVQVFEPIHGYLLKSFEIEKNGTFTMERKIHPRVEPEIAIVLKHGLSGPGVTVRDVENALLGVYPALEIVDSRYENFKFQLSDVVADNTSACGFMVGRENYLSKLSDLNFLGVIVKKNGKIVETGAPAAVLGDPLLSVVGLANILGREKRSIEPGQIILTGGITNSVPFSKGELIEVLWPGETLKFNVQ